MGNFGGKVFQETISKKQPISLDFFWQISLKSTQFMSGYDQRCLTFFITGIIICSFNNNALEKCTNGKAFHIVASAQFFTTLI